MALDYHALAAATNRGTPMFTTDIVSNTDVRDVSDALDLLAIDETPFLNRISWGPDSGGTSIEWISEDLGPGYVVVGSAAASAGASFYINTVEGLTTAEASRQLQTGTVLYCYSSTDGEHGLAVLVSIGTDGEHQMEYLTTGVGSNMSMTAGDKLYILGAVANEGSLPRTGNWRSRVVNSNSFTILRQDVQTSGSQAATDFYAISGEEQHQIRMRLIEMQREREKSALYSAAFARSTTYASLMNGCFGFLGAQTGDNINTTTTSLTESAVNTVVGAVWESGGRNLTWFSDRTQAAKFTQWDKSRIRMEPRDNRGGGHVTMYMTEVGIEMEVVPMPKVPTNIAFVLDVGKIRLRAKKGRKAIMEKLGKAGDFTDWQIISEFSLEVKGYNLHQHGLFTKLS